METKVICITGGIGSGKSTLCESLERRSFPVYYSDVRAKQLMETDEGIISELKELFSDQAYSNGQLNRSYLSQQIFSHPHLKAQLEAVVHPAVRNDFHTWLGEQNAPVVFKESALAIETRDASCDSIVSVVADKQLRIARVLCRNTDWSLEQVLERMKHQITDTERSKGSDYLVQNDGDTEDLELQIDQLLSKLSVI